MIKKLTAILLSLLMLGAFATAQSVDYTGIWYLVSIESQGITLSPADMGMELTMNLNADGTGTASSTGEGDTAATWVLDGDTLIVTADDSPLSLTMNEEGQLVAELEGNTMYFDREPATPSFVPAAEVLVEDIAAFNGTWTITMVNAFGLVIPFSAMAQMGDVGLADGNVIIQDGSVTTFGALEPETGALVDGKLVITSPMGETLGKTLSMLEDGTMLIMYMEMSFYCEKVEVVE
jgi:hypothetical protein